MRILFFCDKTDFEHLMHEVENHFEIHYYTDGHFENPNPVKYHSFFDTPDSGKAISGNWLLVNKYLILPKNISADARSFIQKDGKTIYVYDSVNNHTAIQFTSGGVFKEGILVASEIASTSDDPFVKDFFKTFRKIMKGLFPQKIGDFYVSPRSIEYLEKGWRLVLDMNSPPEYDLKKG